MGPSGEAVGDGRGADPVATAARHEASRRAQRALPRGARRLRVMARIAAVGLAFAACSPARTASRPPHAGGALHGTLRDESGAAFEGAWVTAFSLDPEHPVRVTAVTQADGSFDLGALDPSILWDLRVR